MKNENTIQKLDSKIEIKDSFVSNNIKTRPNTSLNTTFQDKY